MDGVPRRARVVDPDGRAQLHRHAGDPVDRRLKPHDMRRPCERGVRRLLVAGLGIDAQIRAVLPPDERRFRRQPICRAGDCGQRLVPHLDPLGRVRRLRHRFGDDNRDRLADMADLVDRQNRVRRQEEGRAVTAFERHLMRVCRHRTVRDRLQAVAFSIAAR